MTAIGSAMATRISLPIAAIGGISVKMAADFDQSMRKIVGLVGVNREVVDGWRKDVRKLAVQYGVSAKEAADALFFITSAGLRGAEAMDTLEASLKGSMAGMGDVTALADAATSAMNAYGSANLSAERAIEILTGAVRAGKLETESLAPVMGKIVGTAAAMEISFEEVAGVLAVFSRVGVDAATGATAVQAIMSTLLGTSTEGEKALAAVGVTLAQLRDIAAGPAGLIGVMRKLDEALGGNEDALKLVVPNLRAFRGVMNALAQDATVVDTIMSDVANTIGIVDEAAQAAEGPAHRMRVAFAAIKDAFIDLGNLLIPIVVPAMQSIGEVVTWLVDRFKSLPKWIKATTGVIAGLVAGAGPLLLLAGALATTIGSLSAAFVAGTLAISGATAIITLAVGAALSLGLVVRQVVRHWDFFTLHFTELMITIKDAAFTAVERILGHFARIPFIGKKFEEARQLVEQKHEDMLVNSATTLAELEKKWERTALELTFGEGLGQGPLTLKEVFDPLKNGIEEVADTIQKELVEQPLAPAAWVEAATETMNLFSASAREAADLNTLLGESFDLPEAQAEAYRTAIEELVAAGVDLDAQVGPQGQTLREMADIYNDLVAEIDEAIAVQDAMTERQEEAKRILESILTPARLYTNHIQMLQGFLADTTFTQEQFNQAVRLAQEQILGMGDEVAELEKTMGSFSRRALDSFLRFTEGAKDGFRGFVDDALRELQRLTTRMAISQIFKSIGLGEVGSFQHGGFLAAGGVGVVGEAGPELVQAGRSGVSISPMAASASAAYGGGIEGGPVRIELNINAVDARSFSDLVETDPMAVAAPVVRALSTSHALRSMLR
jgi:TP901 family phage tail tape measure protein